MITRGMMLLAIVACLGCAGRPVAIGTRTAAPAPNGPPRTVSGEACSSDLLGIPLENYSRHARAYDRLLKAAGDAAVVDVRIEERWSTLLFSVRYCTKILGTAMGPAPADRERPYWYFIPRFGFAPATGLFGIDFQYRSWGVAIGAICLPEIRILRSARDPSNSDGGPSFACPITTAALRYYSDPHSDSWMVGPVYWHWNQPDEDEPRSRRSHWGFGIEYRWRLEPRGSSAWFDYSEEISLGLAVGGSEPTVLPALTVGLAF